MVNDIISDMLTKIRNANSAKHELVEILYTKITESITKILKEEGLINDFKINNESNSIILLLKFKGQNRKPVIQKLERISKPGLRIYENKKKNFKKSKKFYDIYSINLKRYYDWSKSKIFKYWRRNSL